MTARTTRVASLAATILLVAACSSTGTASPSASTPPAATPTAAASEAATTAPSAAASEAAGCDAVQIGPVTQCEDLYTKYWPTINAAMDKLYEEAKASEGGTVVIWDWYELAPEVISAFETRFPGLTVKTAGYQGNTSSKIVAAKETGTETSDFVSGSLTSAAPLIDGGFFDDVDWTSYGVPQEYMNIGFPNMLPDSINAYMQNVNTSKVPLADAPKSYEDYLDPKWKDTLAMTSWNGQYFTGYGMLNGKDAMQKLITDLKASGNLTLTDDPSTLLSTGDKPIIFAGQLFNPNPELAPVAVKDHPVWIQFNGVNKYGKNKAGAALYALWEALDPDWLKAVLTQPEFTTSSVPFPGLPADSLAQATGLMKTNMDAFNEAAKIGQWENKDNRTQWIDLIKAADEVMYQ